MMQYLSLSIQGLIFAIYPSSIKVRLSLVFLLFLTVVTILGIFSISRLGDVNVVSRDISLRWLQTTRILGDLNNFISDYRTAEGTQLLSSNQAEFSANEQAIHMLEQQISASCLSYEKIPHDTADTKLYNSFLHQWNVYLSYSKTVLELSKTTAKARAVKIYKSSSRDSFNNTSDTLNKLTSHNMSSANMASNLMTSTYQQARLLIITAIIFAVMVIVVAVLYVTRTISNPLLILANRMHQLAKEEVNQDIIGTTRPDAIGEMARAVVVFRDNAVALINSKKILAEQAAALEKALLHERKITQTQRNFVAMASHEFRTPLTIIDGHAQRMIKMKDRLQPQDIIDRSNKIRGAVMRITSLMDGLLNSSQLIDTDTGLNIRLVSFDLPKLLAEVCQLYRDISSGVCLIENLHELPEITADPRLLHQVFSNLIANAIKYSATGSAITIGCYRELDKAVVFVQDCGIGISKEDIEYVFERYYRGSNVSNIAGMGVGLYLVQMIVNLHQGTILVESNADEGTRITIQLAMN